MPEIRRSDIDKRISETTPYWLFMWYFSPFSHNFLSHLPLLSPTTLLFLPSLHSIKQLISSLNAIDNLKHKKLLLIIQSEQLNYGLLLTCNKKWLYIYPQSSFMFYVSKKKSSKKKPKLCTSIYVNSSIFSDQEVTGKKARQKKQWVVWVTLDIATSRTMR